MMIVVCSISVEFSYKHVNEDIGATFNKNTWTRYIKKLGLVSAELLERVRRDPDNKWNNA